MMYNISYFPLWCSTAICQENKAEYLSSLEAWFPCCEATATPTRGSLGRQRTAHTRLCCQAPYLRRAQRNGSCSFTHTFALHPTRLFSSGWSASFLQLTVSLTAYFEATCSKCFWGTSVWAQQWCLLVLGKRKGQPATSSAGLPVHEYVAWQTTTLLILRGSLGLLVQGTGRKEGLEIIMTHSAFPGTIWGCWPIRQRGL